MGSLIIVSKNFCTTMVMEFRADLGEGKAASAPLQVFYLYVTATINSMKITFNDV